CAEDFEQSGHQAHFTTGIRWEKDTSGGRGVVHAERGEVSENDGAGDEARARSQGPGGFQRAAEAKAEATAANRTPARRGQGRNQRGSGRARRHEQSAAFSEGQRSTFETAGEH